MYRPQELIFAFRLKKNGNNEVLEGVSRRYTATALIGLTGEDENILTRILSDHSPDEVCGNLLNNIANMNELGELALTTWAARRLEHPHTQKAIDALKHFCKLKNSYPTVELSWALTALVIDSCQATDMILAKKLAEILMDSFNKQSKTFLHGPSRKGLSSLFSHVSCFADFVYPIQALSHYYQATSDSRAAEIACSCAEHICKLQADDGQWWWHYDNRTGKVLEGYPVYSVHQDSMAPMALFALKNAFGKDYSEAIRKGLEWLLNSSEINGSLIDMERKVIWRKVARREPFRLVRKMQSAASSLNHNLRLPGTNVLFPPVSIDYESRPYHMGWILYAWPDRQATRNE